MASPTTINVLLSTFPGLGLPQTLCIPFEASTTFEYVHDDIEKRIPTAVSYDRLVLSTNSAERLPRHSETQLSTLVDPKARDAFLPLRLHVPCLGGKGGFGSQLRAAGGRMASRKKKGVNVVNSNRNLDGRRIRTIGEAKALAEYLAVKPDMDRKEKEERRKRWESVVEAAERTQQEIKDGTYKNNASRGDGEWVNQKEDVESRIRDDIAKAMEQGLTKGDALSMLEEPGSSEESIEGSEGSDDSEAVPAAEKSAASSSKVANKARKVWGWDDEDDDDMSSSDEDTK